MNEIAIRQFVELTEEYIRSNRDQLEQRDLDKVFELYDDLTNELSRQQLYDNLYH